jgi:hypothetical protein
MSFGPSLYIQVFLALPCKVFGQLPISPLNDSINFRRSEVSLSSPRYQHSAHFTRQLETVSERRPNRVLSAR